MKAAVTGSSVDRELGHDGEVKRKGTKLTDGVHSAEKEARTDRWGRAGRERGEARGGREGAPIGGVKMS